MVDQRLTGNFCEQEIPDSIFKQPISFWTNLAFLATSLWILLWTDYLAAKAHDDKSSIRPQDLFYATAYGFLSLWLGPASMVYHGALTEFGRLIDNAAILWWSSFVMQYEIYRRFVVEPQSTHGRSANGKMKFVTFLGSSMVAFTLLFWYLPETRNGISIAALGTSAFVLCWPPFYSRMRYRCRRIIIKATRHAGDSCSDTVGKNDTVHGARKPDDNVKFLVLGFCAYGFGLVFWTLEQRIWFDCPTTHYYQHHGLWHIGCAFASLFLYYHMFVCRDQSAGGSQLGGKC